MKKHILSLTALVLTATVLAGCSEKASTPNPARSGDSSITQSTGVTSTAEESTSTTESTSSEIAVVPVDNSEHGRFIYGEKEIPDITFPEYDKSDGRRIGMEGVVEGYGLESMVFETHTFGDYTVSLVGGYVRSDKEHFPGLIYTQHLYVEVKKGDKHIGDGGYSSVYTDWTKCECVIYENQIGNYLDVYGTKNPVIAMRYFHNNDVDELLRKVVEFSWIEDDAVVSCVVGEFAEKTGILPFGLAHYGSIEFGDCGYFAIFAADDFKVENENTLVDEEAGIKYIFNFDKPSNTAAWFSTEKIQ